MLHNAPTLWEFPGDGLTPKEETVASGGAAAGGRGEFRTGAALGTGDHHNDDQTRAGKCTWGDGLSLSTLIQHQSEGTKPNSVRSVTGTNDDGRAYQIGNR